MMLQQFLGDIQQQLERADVSTARLDCLVLLEHVLSKNRAYLLAYPELEINNTQVRHVQKLINQRARHMPLAYIIGKTEFYGREFIITPAVLEPRPESENIIDVLKVLANKHYNSAQENIRIIDVGTGSGALGITAALEIPGSQVILTDIDEAALDIARQNCQHFELDIPCTVNDLLAPAANLETNFDIVLANLPYVPNDYQINKAALHEPTRAIFGGLDGLDLYRRMFVQLQQLTDLKPSHILTESLPFQHEALSAIAKKQGYTEILNDDFIQLFSIPNTY